MSKTTGQTRPSLSAFWAQLDGPQRRTLTAMAAAVLALHVIGFITLIAVVAPSHYGLGATGVYTVGVGVTAYTLGLRHAFDADHIAAIDNTTRKLMQEEAPAQRRLLVLARALHDGVRARVPDLVRGALARRCRQERQLHLHHDDELHRHGVSGLFLYAIAALNVVVLIRIVKVFREMAQGGFDEQELELQLRSAAS